MDIGRRPVVILGAGLAGLTAADWLRKRAVPVIIYEAAKQISGLTASFQEDGFTFDFGAHFITSRLAQELGIADQCRDVAYYGESVYLAGRHYSYPEGLLMNPRFAAGGLVTVLGRGPSVKTAKNLADHFTALYGWPLARDVAVPLVEAWSGTPAIELAPSVADKIPVGIAHTLFLKLMSRLTKRAIAVGYGKEQPTSRKVRHVYPRGGTSLLCHKLAEPLQGSIEVESKVEAIHVQNGSTVGVQVNGGFVPAAAVISTAPCNLLPSLIRGSTALNYLSQFRFRAMVFVMLRLRGRGLLKDTVIWVPEKQYSFFRLTETPISMPWQAPEGKTIITVDLGCERGDEIWSKDEQTLASLCLNQLELLIPDIRSRYLGVHVLRTPYAYPIFLNDYEKERVAFQQGTGIKGLYSLGRNGEFDHLLTEDVHVRTLAKMPQVLAELTGPAQFRATHP